MSSDTISCSRICTNIELVLHPEELKSNTSCGRPGMGSFSDRSMFFLGDKHRTQDTTRAGALQFGAFTQGQSISMAAMGLKGTDRDARTRPPADLLEDGRCSLSNTSSWVLVSPGFTTSRYYFGIAFREVYLSRFYQRHHHQPISYDVIFKEKLSITSDRVQADLSPACITRRDCALAILLMKVSSETNMTLSRSIDY